MIFRHGLGSILLDDKNFQKSIDFEEASQLLLCHLPGDALVKPVKLEIFATFGVFRVPLALKRELVLWSTNVLDGKPMWIGASNKELFNTPQFHTHNLPVTASRL